MNQSITLNINSHVLQQATTYAQERGMDISGLVESLLKKITKEKENKPTNTILPLQALDPFVQNLIGVVHINDKEVGLDGETRKSEYLKKE